MDLVKFEKIPLELRQARRWVLWKSGKIPYQTNGEPASSTDPATWTTFDAAWNKYYEDVDEVFAGIGCVVAAPYVAIDLDKCRDPKTGEVQEWATEAIQELNSYTELSPSGRGFHIWVRGGLPPGGNRTGSVEMYAKERYFTITGQHLEGTPEIIHERILIDFHRKHILVPALESDNPAKDVSLSAKEFARICSIWERLGESASELDVKVEFFKNGQYREKWDKNKSYIDRTIRKAKESVFGLSLHNEARLIKRRFSEIDDKAIEWLWQDRIPRGKLTMFSGNPDCGKTTVLCDIIARITTGQNYPDGSAASEVGEVLFFSSEDDPADTLKPRLRAAGAKMESVISISGLTIRQNSKQLERDIALDTDLQVLEIELAQNPAITLVAIDPIASYLGERDANKDQSLRKVLVPIKNLAEKTGVTFICLSHFNKRVDVGALHKVGGAVGMTGVSRAAWLFFKNPEKDGEYLMALGKGNLTNRRTSMKYRITAAEVPTGTAPKIEWLGEDNRDADTIFETLKSPEGRAAAKAEQFIKDFLTTPMLSRDIERVAEEAGIRRSALWEAKKSLNIQTKRVGTQWQWVPLSGETQAVSTEEEFDEIAYS